MDFYILRHGPAEERCEAWPDDRDRPLTADGKARTREAAAGLKALDVSPDAIYTSPLVRARQTAEIVARELGLVDRLIETDNLEPGAPATALLKEIEAKTPLAGSVMVVGHEPDLGYLASRLLAGDAHAVAIELKKPGLIRVEVDGVPPTGRGVLKWVLTPGMLRSIAKGR